MVLLQRGRFFDDHISITQSAVFENQPSMLHFLWITPSSIGPKLIKAALDCTLDTYRSFRTFLSFVSGFRLSLAIVEGQAKNAREASGLKCRSC